MKNNALSKGWRAANRGELLSAGMPDFLIDDEKRWEQVLRHGNDELRSGWDPSWISPGQAAVMLRLFHQNQPNLPSMEILGELERRANTKSCE
jgi:hypothetical protein